MNPKIRFYIIASLFASTFFVGCNNSRYTTGPTFRRPVTKTNIRYRSPRFMKNVEIGGNDANKISMIVVESYNHGRKEQYITDLLLLKYAQKMDVMPQMITNYPLYRYIEDWYGVRYRYGGNDRSGIDCSAFTQQLYNHVYCTQLVRTSYQQYKMSDIVWDTDKINEGDLVFFRTRGRRISHVGIYLTNDYFVHASTSSGIIISNLNEDYWRRKYAGAGKVPHFHD